MVEGCRSYGKGNTVCTWLVFCYTRPKGVAFTFVCDGPFPRKSRFGDGCYIDVAVHLVGYQCCTSFRLIVGVKSSHSMSQGVV